MITPHVKPAIVKIGHKIVLPKAVRIAQHILPPQSRVIQRGGPKQIVASLAKTPYRLLQQYAQPPVRQPRSLALSSRGIKPQQSKPEIKFLTRDVPEHHRRKIIDLHDTCRDRVLVILGNGPSLLECDIGQLRVCKFVDVLTINKPDERVWPTKYWLFMDASQLQRHRAYWNTYDGIIFNSPMIQEVKPRTIQIKSIPGSGFSLNLGDGLFIGQSSVYSSMQVANWLNYDRVYILGIDMCAVVIDGKKMVHFFGANPDVMPEARIMRFDAEARYYETAGNTLPEEVRKKFYFCSAYNKYPFIDKFNRLDHKTAIQEIFSYAEQYKEIE